VQVEADTIDSGLSELIIAAPSGPPPVALESTDAAIDQLDDDATGQPADHSPQQRHA